MTINHNVSLDMNDIAELLKEKIGSKIGVEDIIINDYTTPEAPEPPEDTEGVGEVKAVKTSELVKKSNIVKALKEGLKAANAENRFPKNAKKTCEDALNDTLEDFSKKDVELFIDIINTKGFTKFALLWQKYQTTIQNAL